MSEKIELLIEATDSASSVLGNIGKSLSSIGDIAKGVFVGGILGKGIDLLSGAIGSVKDAMIGGNAEFERYQTQFGVLMGGADKAKERLAMLAEFGAKTPFELPELVKADKVLLSFGLHSDTTAKKFGVSGEQILTTIGDIAAGTGVGFEELSLTFGKFASGATGEAIARFQELGIATREQMASWGLEFSKSGQLLTPVDKAFGILEQNVRKKFGGMMDAQSQTFEGMVSNFQDWLGQVGRMLGAPIFDALKTNLAGLLTFLGSDAVKGAISGMAAGMATGITQAIAAFQQFSAVITPVLLGVIDLFTNTEDGGNDLLYALEAITGSKLPDWLIAATFSFYEFQFELRDAFAQIPTIISNAFASFSLIGAQITTAMVSIQPALDGILQSVISIFGSLIPIALAQGQGAWTLISTTIQTAITSAIAIVQTWLPVVQTVLAGIALFLTAHGAEIQLLVSTAWNAVTTIIQTAIDTVTVVINALAPVVLAIFGQISTFLNAHGSEILGFLTASWNSISAIVGVAAELVQTVVTRVFGAVAGFIETHGDTIQRVLTGAWNVISAVIGAALDTIKSVISLALAVVNGDWDKAWSEIKNITDTANKLIGVIISTAMDLITGVISSAVSVFQLSWSQGLEAMRTIAITAWDAIKLAIDNAIESAKIVIANGVEAFIAKFNNLKDKMSVIGQQLLEGMVQGIRDKIGWLVDEGVRAANAVLTAIKSTLGINSPSKEAIPFGEGISEGLALGISDSVGLPIEAGADMADRTLERIRVTLEPLPQIVAPILTQTASTMVNAWSGLNDDLEDQILGAAESIVELAQHGDSSSLVFAQSFENLKQTITGIIPSFNDSKNAIARMHETLAAGKFDVQAYWKIYEEMMQGIGQTTTQVMPVVTQTTTSAMETIVGAASVMQTGVTDAFQNILVLGGVAINTLTGQVVNSSNQMQSAIEALENRASASANAIAASMIAAGQVINTTQQQLANFIQSGGVGGITGGIYTPSQAFQDSFKNQAPITPAPPRPSSVPKPSVVNNTPINITITGGNVDRYAVEDGVMTALRRSGLAGRSS